MPGGCMKRIVFSTILATALGACSGGGGAGGGGVAVSPPPAPPLPVNTTITDLVASQSFTNDATQTDVSYNTVSKRTISGRAAAAPLTVRYDAANGSYTISGGSFSETFIASDKQAATTPAAAPGETRYVRSNDTGSVTLTLVTTPYYGTTSNRYVGLGYLQRNGRSDGRQDTRFNVFAYGLDTPASGVPRNGRGSFTTDVFGLSSVPGDEPESFQGRGRFDVDFINGVFFTETSVTRQSIVSDTSRYGGGIDLTGGGRLSATDGSFVGDVVYSSGSRQIAGKLAGRFYGPNATELGAGFSGAASDGAAFNGALTAQINTSLTPANLSVSRLAAPEIFYGDATTLTVRTPRNGGALSVSDYPGQLGYAVSRVQFTDKTSGNVSYGTPSSNMPGGEYTVTSIVPGDSNFTTYTQTIIGQPTRLELYKTGTDNRELALTYTSFGKYSNTRSDDPFEIESNRTFFIYGFKTPSGLFANRTGTASYAGVAYGAAADAKGVFYDVTGSSKLSVDFGSQSLTGNLALTGRNDTTTIDYGNFGFAGTIVSYASTGTADIQRGGSSIGSMLVNFYGPTGEEAAGVFRLRVPDGVGANTLINGALVAKQQ